MCVPTQSKSYLNPKSILITTQTLVHIFHLGTAAIIDTIIWRCQFANDQIKAHWERKHIRVYSRGSRLHLILSGCFVFVDKMNIIDADVIIDVTE